MNAEQENNLRQEINSVRMPSAEKFLEMFNGLLFYLLSLWSISIGSLTNVQYFLLKMGLFVEILLLIKIIEERRLFLKQAGELFPLGKTKIVIRGTEIAVLISCIQMLILSTHPDIHSLYNGQFDWVVLFLTLFYLLSIPFSIGYTILSCVTIDEPNFKSKKQVLRRTKLLTLIDKGTAELSKDLFLEKVATAGMIKYSWGTDVTNLVSVDLEIRNKWLDTIRELNDSQFYQLKYLIGLEDDKQKRRKGSSSMVTWMSQLIAVTKNIVFVLTGLGVIVNKDLTSLVKKLFGVNLLIPLTLILVIGILSEVVRFIWVRGVARVSHQENLATDQYLASLIRQLEAEKRKCQ